MHFKDVRDSLDLAQNLRIEWRASAFVAVSLRIMFSDLVIYCSIANSESSSHITVTKADTANSVGLTYF
jgi:hypothetical protein